MLWVDPRGSLALARQPGKAHLMYTLDLHASSPPVGPNTSRTDDSSIPRFEPLTYSVRVDVQPLPGDTVAMPLRLVAVGGGSSRLALLPIVPDPMLASAASSKTPPTILRFALSYTARPLTRISLVDK